MLVALKNYLDERRMIRASVQLAAAADAAAVDTP
jgi:hypothetical protein